jgi:hypothetical protein
LAIQIASTVDLITAQRVVIANALFVEEYKRPTTNLVSQFTLGQGEKSLVIPKVAQMTADRLSDGVDLTNSQNIGMTTNTVSPVEAGLKVILTDKLVRQLNESVFAIIGTQIGEAMGTIKEVDIIALFQNLNGGTALGGDGKLLTLNNLSACISVARDNKYGEDLVIVHHANAIFAVAKDFFGAVPQRLDAPSFVDSVVRDFYSFSIGGVPIFEANHIPKIGSDDSGYGAIMSRRALGFLTSVGLSSAMERDESLRASELITISDYIAFELDDARGAPMQYEILAHVTNT